jgi:hypothetical protein
MRSPVGVSLLAMAPVGCPVGIQQLHPRDISLYFLLSLLGILKRPFKGILPSAEKQFAIDPAHPVAAKVHFGGAVAGAHS